jgi:putative sigma-54 modulation protein
MEAGERVTEYINKKVSKLERYIGDIEETRVDLALVKSARNSADRNVAQITIHGKGFILRSEERSDDMFAAIDTSLDKIERQIARFKGKRARGRGDGSSAAEVTQETPVNEEVESHAVIARRKQFTLVPMDENEAMEQMALLCHENFFIFYNANTSSINVLYHRRDGTYGLIEPLVG